MSQRASELTGMIIFDILLQYNYFLVAAFQDLLNDNNFLELNTW